MTSFVRMTTFLYIGKNSLELIKELFSKLILNRSEILTPIYRDTRWGWKIKYNSQNTS